MFRIVKFFGISILSLCIFLIVASSTPVSAIEGFLGSLVLAVFLAVADELLDSSDEGDHFLFVKIKVKSDSTKDHNSTKEF